MRCIGLKVNRYIVATQGYFVATFDGRGAGVGAATQSFVLWILCCNLQRQALRGDVLLCCEYEVEMYWVNDRSEFELRYFVTIQQFVFINKYFIRISLVLVVRAPTLLMCCECVAFAGIGAGGPERPYAHLGDTRERGARSYGPIDQQSAGCEGGVRPDRQDRRKAH